MTEQGAAPDNGVAVERLEAQGPQGLARPRKARRLADRKAGLREPVAHAPEAPPRRSIPSFFEGARKQGIRASRQPELKPPACGALASCPVIPGRTLRSRPGMTTW